jgi:hypothetical protein
MSVAYQSFELGAIPGGGGGTTITQTMIDQLTQSIIDTVVPLIADAVWDELIAAHNTVSTFGAKNQKLVPSETINDYKADVSGLATSAALTTHDNALAVVDGNVDEIETDVNTIKTKTDQLNFTGDDVKATLDGEEVDADVIKVEGVTLQGKVGDNFDHFFQNSSQDTTKIVDDVGSDTSVVMGAGNDVVTCNVEDNNSNPVSDASTWISTNSTGTNVIAGTLQTDDAGDVTFLLDAGLTYYFWMHAPGYNSIIGEEFVAVANPTGNSFSTTVITGGDVGVLSDIRVNFIKASRRYDLIVDGDIATNTDNGANRFINAGMRYLDMRLRRPREYHRHMFALSAGDFQLTMAKVISLKRLTVIDSDGRTDITSNVYSPQEFRAEFPDLIADWTNGDPRYWTTNIASLSPTHRTDGDDAAAFAAASILDYDDVDFGDTYEEDHILLYPPSDGTHTVEVIAKFFSQDLSADADYSYWTKNFPELCVIAACYALERELRNSEGQKNWLDAMEPMIQEIDNIVVERMMEGEEMDTEAWIW